MFTQLKRIKKMKETNFTSSSSTMTQEIGGGGGAIGQWRSLPPAFLTKTYQIIDDPTTNSIASWGKYGDSFIIWDHIKFSAQILPKYFRHNNFASFVYQLNNYGFRKIGVEHQWEYTNPYFQMQKPHLLSNMKRRSEQNATPRRHRNNIFCPEKMKDAIDESKLEIEKLKMQQLEIDFHITALEQEANSISAATKKMVASWAEACGIIAKRRRETAGNQKADDEDEAAGKRKKAAEYEEVSDKNGGGDLLVEEMVKELSTPLSEMEPMNCGDDGEGKLKSEMCSNYLDFCKVIMLDDDEEVFQVGGGDHSKQAQISKDFQDLIMD